eukprot:TRINITY_DN987_c0_g1_i1.p1 TRINITY_DN987_c0_g1~~TRINITY_DN987_c0_g1_i1.p1  ORF type:complete len:1313 (+),score=468.07 TRINITY_DN987_c0_g1_i1:211-4149(+)
MVSQQGCAPAGAPQAPPVPTSSGKLRRRAAAPPGSWAFVGDGESLAAADYRSTEPLVSPVMDITDKNGPTEQVIKVGTTASQEKRPKTWFGYLPLKREMFPQTKEGVSTNIIAGVVNGCVESVVCMTFAGVIFNNLDRNLEALLPLGASLMLYSTFVALTWNGLFGRLPYSLCTSARGISTVILARESVSIAEALRGAPEKVGPTIMCYLATATFTLGLTFFICGKVGMGRLMLLFPAPVTSGFLGSVGVLAVRGSLQMASGVPFYRKTSGSVLPAAGDTFMWPSDWAAFLAPNAIGQVMAMLAMVLFVRSVPSLCKKYIKAKSFEHLWDFLCILISLAVFYVAIFAAGIGLDELRDTTPRWVLHWESATTPSHRLWEAYDLTRVELTVIAQHFHPLLAVSLLSFLSLVLNLSDIQQQFPLDSASGPESLTDLNHELAAQGVVNVFLGCSGGHIAFTNCPGTYVNRSMGGTHRLSGFIAAAVVALVFLSGGPFSHFLPNFFAGGMLMIIGISFLEVVLAAYRKLPFSEFTVTAAVVVVTTLFSIECAIMAGLAVVVFQFLQNATNVSPIRDCRNGAVSFSCTKRPDWERSVLQQYGQRIVIVELEGFLFFGTAVRVSDTLMEMLNEDVEFILLDFARVSSLDSTASEAFARSKAAAEDASCQLLFCGLSAPMAELLQISGVIDYGQSGAVQSAHADLNAAHEFCEEQILCKYLYNGMTPEPKQEPFRSRLMFHSALRSGGEIDDEVFCLLLDIPPRLACELREWTQRCRVPKGGSVFEPGQRNTGLVFIRAGVVDLRTVRFGRDGAPVAGDSGRLHIRHPAGNAVGKAEFLRATPHSYRAVVSSDNGALLWVLTSAAWERLKAAQPELRMELMEFLLRDMAEDARAAAGLATCPSSSPARLLEPRDPLSPGAVQAACSPPSPEEAVISPLCAPVPVPVPVEGSPPVVWVWNEWDPLEEVIVGIADGNAVPPLEEAHHAKVWDKPHIQGTAGQLRRAESVRKANRQLDNFAAILEARGITVRRPRAEPNTPIITPHWEVKVVNGWTCPRDCLLAVGNELIEAPMSWRSRVNESNAYRDILNDYFRRDKNMRWISAPRPELTDRLYRKMRDVPAEQRKNMSASREFVTHDDVEPVFDAADCMKFGNDLFVIHGNTTNLAGIQWLRQHLAPLGVRVQVLHFPQIPNPSHLDAYIMPLRPGLMLALPQLCDGPELDVFRRNGWRVMPIAPPCGPPLSPLAKSSPWIHLNMFGIDPETVVVDEEETYLIQQLEELGMQCIPVPFRDVIEFGGGLHCCTQDVRRRCSPADYFPDLVSS